MLAARSSSEWTASLRMPRLPVSTPTMSFATTRAAPMKTAPSATRSGRLANDSIDLTLTAFFLLQERGRHQELGFGAEGDQQVAIFQLKIGGWTHVQRSVPAPQGQQLRRRRIEQPGLRDALADRRHRFSDEQLFDTNAQFAVVERVQHVDQRGAHGQLCDAVARHLVRRNRPGCARELETPDRFGASGPRDDVEVGLESSSGEDDVDGALVGIDRRDQTPRALDARLFEQLLAGRVAFNVQAALGAQPADRFARLVDHCIWDLVVLELGDDLSPYAAVAAQDEM